MNLLGTTLLMKPRRVKEVNTRAGEIYQPEVPFFVNLVWLKR